MDPLLVKKIVSALLYPYTLSLLALIVGIALLAAGRARKAGRVLAVAGLVLLLVQSMPLVPNSLAGHMEEAYPPILAETPIPEGVRWVVVLSGASYDDPRVPVTSRNLGDTLHRVVEGVVLAWRVPEATLLMSGGDVYGDGVAAKVMAEMAVELKFPADRLVTEGQSRDTEQQARLIAAMVGKDKLLLVTSVRHMERAMALFKEYGMDAVAAPTAHPARSSRKESLLEELFPNPRAAAMSASIAHEKMGEWWYRVKEWVK